MILKKKKKSFPPKQKTSKNGGGGRKCKKENLAFQNKRNVNQKSCRPIPKKIIKEITEKEREEKYWTCCTSTKFLPELYPNFNELSASQN